MNGWPQVFFILIVSISSLYSVILGTQTVLFKSFIGLVDIINLIFVGIIIHYNIKQKGDESLIKYLKDIQEKLNL